MSLCINPDCEKVHNSDTAIFCQGCGSELLLDGRYRAVGELGQGGFGITYEVIDWANRLWVLKVLIDNHPKYVELFKQEVQLLKLLDRPGIPKTDLDGYFTYFPVGREEPLHCLVMEKIEGLNLSQYIKQRGNRPIKPKRALRWLAELTLLLEQVHEKNFFHRDIKPSNIMLRANGRLALIDFGTAGEVTQSYLQKMALGEITGVVTQGYTPMEQVRGEAVLQSDFYALGGTMVYLLTAQNPSDFYDFTEERLIWQSAVPNIAPEFVNLIDRMMAFSPAKRPTNSRAIFNEIVAIDSSLRILDEHFDSTPRDSQLAKPAAKQSTEIIVSTADITTKFSSSSDSKITPEFIERCRRELAVFIGPMANIICQRTVKQNPFMTESEFYHSLAKIIRNPQQAQEFQKRFGG